MDPEATIEAYYEALRAGDPLSPFFADDGLVVKVGIGERLLGAGAVAAGLRRQTETTTDWTVESRDRRVAVDGTVAWYVDDARLAWTDTDRGERFDVDTRWTATLRRRDGDWRFVSMHVSAPAAT